jgi:hypothetical protein
MPSFWCSGTRTRVLTEYLVHYNAALVPARFLYLPDQQDVGREVGVEQLHAAQLHQRGITVAALGDGWHCRWAGIGECR